MKFVVVVLVELMLLTTFSFAASNITMKRQARRSRLFVDKENALNFVKRDAISDAASALYSECCDGEACDWEERAEVSEDYGWTNVNKALCKLSIQEGKSCTCKRRRDKGSYECASDLVGRTDCVNPCSSSKFNCESGRRCVERSQKCDSNNDCGNWRDEVDCTISSKRSRADIIAKTKLKTRGQDNEYFGNIFIDERPVCDDRFGGKMVANIVCKTKFQRDNIQGVPFTGSYFGNLNSNNFIMSQISCSGNEGYIGDCSHTTYNFCYYDYTMKGAGVACLDADTLELRGGTSKYEGNAYIVGQPFMMRPSLPTWNIATVKVICSQLHGAEFNRGSEGVPAFTHDAKFEGDTPDYCAYAMCKGTEKQISDCELFFSQWCNENHLAPVQCATCTPQNLLDILKMLSYDGTAEMILESIQAAKRKLDSDCRNWIDCLEPKPQYPEFCKVRAFLEDVLIYTKPVTKANKVIISTTVDPMQLLSHNIMEQKFAEINTKLDEVGSTITTQMGNYFGTLAQYDRELAKADVAYNYQSWEAANSTLVTKQKALAKEITDIFVFAFTITSANFLQKTAATVLSALAMGNPIGYIVKSADSILDFQDRLNELSEEAVALAQLSFLVDQTLPEMNEKLEFIKGKIADNRRVFSKTKKLLKIANKDDPLTMDDFTKQDAKDFLDEYTAYSPAVINYEVKEYMALITNMVDQACDVIEGTDVLAGSIPAIVAAAMGSCPKARVNAEVIDGAMDDLAEKQIDLMDAYARVCRAKIAEVGALKVKQSLVGSAQEQIEKQIIKWQAMYLLRAHKTLLIKNACNYLTYMSHNSEPARCTQLLRNPDGDAGPIVASEKFDMCAGPGVHQRTGVFRIPAHFKGKKPGSINLNSLFEFDEQRRTDGRTIFKIPDRDWLVKNQWVDEDEQGPFFLKRLNIYLPPSATHKHWLKLKMKLLDSGFPKKSYMVDGGAFIANRFTENPGPECQKKESNPYNVKACNSKLGDICIDTDGTIHGRLLPRLENSTWTITLRGEHRLTGLYPEGTIYLFARAKYCFKSTSKKKKARKAEKKQDIVPGHTTCCTDNNQYYNLMTGQCQACTSPESKIRLYDYYCEKCPKGYTTNTFHYGCTPCGPGTFKDVEGKADCQPCAAGLVAPQLGAIKCIPGAKKKKAAKKSEKKKESKSSRD